MHKASIVAVCSSNQVIIVLFCQTHFFIMGPVNITGVYQLKKYTSKTSKLQTWTSDKDKACETKKEEAISIIEGLYLQMSVSFLCLTSLLSIRRNQTYIIFRSCCIS